jgi:DNA-binding transcriptional ArsR family regulator
VATNQEVVLNALGDPTRRAVLRLLRKGPLPVGAIAQAFPISRPAISQHLKILKDAGLVTDSAVATRRLYELNPEAFHSLRAYFDEFWSAALGESTRRAYAPRPRRRRSA